MKGKMRLIILSVCMSGCLTGCGNVISDMTEAESEQISEYAAAVLLAYDKDYHGRLLNEEEMAKAEEEEAIAQAREEAVRRIAEQTMKEKEQSGEDADGSGSGKDGEQTVEKEAVVLADFLGLSGFDVQYDGVSLEDSYPSGELDLNDNTSAFFAMRPSEGNRLLVVRLRVTNTSSQDQLLDLLSKQVHFTINGDTIGKNNTLVTMLEDDFSVYSGNVAAGASVQTVLIAEVKAGQEEMSGTLSLGVKYNGDSATIALQ